VALDNLREVDFEVGELGKLGVTTHGEAGKEVSVGGRGIADDEHRLVAVIGRNRVTDALGQFRQNLQPLHHLGRFLPLGTDFVFTGWVVQNEAGLGEGSQVRRGDRLVCENDQQRHQGNPRSSVFRKKQSH